MKMSSFLMNPVPYGEAKLPQADDFHQASYLHSQESDFYRTPYRYHQQHHHNSLNQYNISAQSFSSQERGSSVNNNVSVSVSVNGVVFSDPISVSGRNYEEDNSQDDKDNVVRLSGSSVHNQNSFGDKTCIGNVCSSSVLSSPTSSSALSLSMSPVQSAMNKHFDRGALPQLTGGSPSSVDEASDCRGVPSSVMTCVNSYSHHHQHLEYYQQQHHQGSLQQLSPSSTRGKLSPPLYIGDQSPYPGDGAGGPGSSPCDEEDEGMGKGDGSQPVIYPWMRKSQSGKIVLQSLIYIIISM